MRSEMPEEFSELKYILERYIFLYNLENSQKIPEKLNFNPSSDYMFKYCVSALPLKTNQDTLITIYCGIYNPNTIPESGKSGLVQIIFKDLQFAESIGKEIKEDVSDLCSQYNLKSKFTLSFETASTKNI